MSSSTSFRSMKSLVVMLVVGLNFALAKVTLIDLTHRLGLNTIYWPSNPPFNMTAVTNNSRVLANYIHTPEHIGTHMDAPRHFCIQGKHVHEFTLEQLSGPGVVLDFRSQAEQNVDYLVSDQDVKNWEKENGLIPEGAIVLLKFGWNKYWPNWEQVFNTNDVSNFSSFHWPGLSLEASEYMAGTRKVLAIGLDVVSGDPGQSLEKKVHVNLLCDHGVIILENVANIDAMPTTGSRVYIGAVKLEYGGGAPVRLFAIVDDEGDPNGAGEITLSVLCVLLPSMIVTMNV